MRANFAPELLRPGLLDEVSVLLAGPSASGVETAPGFESAFGPAVLEVCGGLGARLGALSPLADPGGVVEDGELDAAVTAAVSDAGGIDVLVVDGAGLFADGLVRAADAHAALRACMDGAWSATRAVVNGAFLSVAADDAREPLRRIVYIAPAERRESRPGAGDATGFATFACAVRAGLENLARTLSVEWARHTITTVAIAPGVESTAGEVATLVAYLASPAGAYFSGCLLDLCGVG